MFYRLILKKDVELHPKFFGPNLRDTLKAKVTAEVRQLMPTPRLAGECELMNFGLKLM